jgi:hypothetical protein
MPIFHDCVQYSPEYDRFKLGLPTSSNFKKIVTPTLAKKSDQRKDYAYLLIAERLLDRRIETYQSEEMRLGIIQESEAADWYAMDRDVEIKSVGFITDDDRTMGCSPDRLVGDDGLLEVKCFTAKEHIRCLCEGKIAVRHRPQLQGQLHISQRSWVDILLWHRGLPKQVIRVEPDEPFLTVLRKELAKFVEFIETEIDKIRTAGYVHVPQAKAELLGMLRASSEASP